MSLSPAYFKSYLSTNSIKIIYLHELLIFEALCPSCFVASYIVPCPCPCPCPCPWPWPWPCPCRQQQPHQWSSSSSTSFPMATSHGRQPKMRKKLIAAHKSKDFATVQSRRRHLPLATLSLTQLLFWSQPLNTYYLFPIPSSRYRYYIGAAI